MSMSKQDYEAIAGVFKLEKELIDRDATPGPYMFGMEVDTG